MTILQQKQLAFLEETCAHYNSKNRGVNRNGKCLYAKGCAIGRHIQDKNLCRRFDKAEFNGVDALEIFSQLPDSLKELELNFLLEIQRLHDSSSAWDENGLSSFGSELRRNIINKFLLI